MDLETFITEELNERGIPILNKRTGKSTIDLIVKGQTLSNWNPGPATN